MRTILVTGANRGIGLEFVRQLRARGDRVFAGHRAGSDTAELLGLAERHGDGVVPVVVDVADAASIEGLAAKIQPLTEHLDGLINNAGIYAAGEEGLDTADAAKMRRVYEVNVIGPVLLTRAVRPFLARGHRPFVASLTSGAGLLRAGLPEPGGQYSYGATKAALHFCIPRLAADLQADGIVVVGIGPGFVRTDMTGGAGAPAHAMPPERSIAGMLRVLDGLQPNDTGSFWSWDGSRCAWAV